MARLSIIIPVYNGAATLRPLVERVQECLSNHDLEIVLVNDGSADDSDAVCQELATTEEGIKFISLRKNFGEHNAVMCGLNFMTGEYAIIIDDDFQNPPEEIEKLVTEAELGYDVVYSKYAVKKHRWLRNLGSKFNDIIATFLLNKPRNLYLSSFKLIRKEVADEIIRYNGPFPYVDGLLLRVTRNIGSTLVEHHPRQSGKSNYTFRKLVSLYLNMFLNFSVVPLRVCTVVGVLTFILGVMGSIAAVIERFLNPDMPTGWTSIMVVLLLLSGTQMMFLGITGEFLGKQYLDQNGTPQWVIKKKVIDSSPRPAIRSDGAEEQAG